MHLPILAVLCGRHELFICLQWLINSKAHNFKDRWISSSSKSPKLQSNGGSIRRQQITMVTEIEKFKSVDN